MLVLIDTAVLSVSSRMTDRNLDENEEERGSNYLIVNQLKVEAHKSEAACTNDACAARIKFNWLI